MRRQAAAIEAGLDALEQEAETLAADLADIGAVSVACVLGYLDFRWLGGDWRRGRHRLAQWLDRVNDHESLLSMRHRLPSSGYR